jgi:hypothetical protein
MGCLSPKLVVVIVLNAMAECGDAGTEPPSSGFATAIVAEGWPPHVP